MLLLYETPFVLREKRIAELTSLNLITEFENKRTRSVCSFIKGGLCKEKVHLFFYSM